MRWSFPTILGAMLMAHAGVLAIKLAGESTKPSFEALAPIQLTTFKSDAPFRPGLPQETATPVAKPRPLVNPRPSAIATPAPQAPSEVASATEASAAGAAGSGGVASDVNAAGSVGSGNGRQIYLSELRARLEAHKHYPAQARRLGQTGSVEVTFTVEANGRITNPRVTRPSPFQRLNASALETIEALKEFKPLPAEFGQDQLVVTLPIHYKTL